MPPKTGTTAALERKLWCLTEGGGRPFSVLISPISDVFDLQKLVLLECALSDGPFRNAAAKDIILMKINANYLDNKDRILTGDFQPNTDDETFLDNPMEVIAQVWPTAPPAGYISVFVRPPCQVAPGKRPREVDDLYHARQSKILIMSPSTAGEPAKYKSLQKEASQKILDDRPCADVTPPASLLYEGFGHFLDDYKRPRPVNSAQRDLENAVDRLANKMANFHRDEEYRMTEGLDIINEILGKTLMPATIGKARTDGYYLGPHKAATCIVEFKKSIPTVELTAYFAHSHNRSMDKHGALYRGWNVPCLGLTVVGPYVTFYGITFIGQWRTISLTPTLSCLVSASEGGDRQALYAAFHAAVALLHRIDEDAQRLLDRLPTILYQDRTFPYPSQIRIPARAPSSNGSVLDFQILRHHLKSENRQLYVAKTLNLGLENKEIIIKFTHRYSIALHDFCAGQGHAPRVIGFNMIPGGWFMIAMEYIPKAVPPSQSPDLSRLRETWIANLRKLVKSFHEENLVHGDLREPNVICNGNQVMLVDFDRGGTAGEVSYPQANLNPDLTNGRTSNDAAITKEDDLRVLEHTITNL